MTECMTVVFIDVTKCRAVQRNQFISNVQPQLSQMTIHSTAGQQQRITDQTTKNEEREVYASSPGPSCVYVIYLGEIIWGTKGGTQGNNVIIGWAIVINKVVTLYHVRDHK